MLILNSYYIILFPHLLNEELAKYKENRGTLLCYYNKDSGLKQTYDCCSILGKWF